jgi:hypothetical protein
MAVEELKYTNEYALQLPINIWYKLIYEGVFKAIVMWAFLDSSLGGSWLQHNNAGKPTKVNIE